MVTVSTTSMNGHEMFEWIPRLEEIYPQLKVELFFDTLPFLKSNYFQRYLPNYVREHRLGMHCPISGCDLLADEGSLLLQYTLDRHEGCLSLAAELEIPYFVLHTNGGMNLTEREQKSRKGRLTERIVLLTEMAKSYSCEVWTENVGFSFDKSLVADEITYKELILNHLEFSSLVDIGHAYMNGWDIPQLIQALGKNIKGVHLHDNKGEKDSHLPIGKGSIHWCSIWKSLSQQNHEIECILEYAPATSWQELADGIQKILSFEEKEIVF